MKRVFIGMTEIAGYYYNLSQGLKRKGCSVSEFYFEDHKFIYGSSTSYPLIFTLVRKAKQRLSLNENIFNKLLDRVLSAGFLIYALFKFDVFIFGFGTSIMPNNKDLKILKLFNKIVISNIAHGSEARPPYINGAKRRQDGSYLTYKELSELAITMKDKISFIENHSSYVIGAPLSCHYLHRPFISLLSIGLPIANRSEFKVRSKSTKNSIRILHSPSNPLVKGTAEVRKVINDLIEEGYSIEYKEIINCSNKVVIDEIIQCDFVVDQLYSDTPMAGFATEAAFFGKPAVVGGYGWEILRKYVAESIFPPSEICHPDSLKKSIIRLLDNQEYRHELGKSAYEFVSNNYTAEIVAEKFIHIMNYGGEKEWFIDPKNIIYLHGVGVNEKDSKLLIAGIINNNGIEGLGVSEKPKLEEAFQTFSSRT